jgi:membrane-associated phospholipid phosphatase
MIGIIAVVVATWMSAARLSFDWRSAALPLAGCLALGGLVWMYSYRRCDERIATSLTGVMQLVAFTATGEILSYLVASTGRPLWDASLFAWDKALGLDWRAYLAFVNERPWLGICYTVAYQSLMPQTIIAVIALGLGGHLLACRRFVAAFILSGLISIVISGAMPAVAMFAYLGLQPQDYPNLHPAAAFVHVAHLAALRDGSMQVISLHDAQGIITFPSYHAALGVIFACSFWSHRWLRWPGVVVNALLIAATPIDGGHYFVDVIAGIIIAIVSLLAICLLADRSQQRASLPRDIAVPGALGAPRSKV